MFLTNQLSITNPSIAQIEYSRSGDSSFSDEIFVEKFTLSATPTEDHFEGRTEIIVQPKKISVGCEVTQKVIFSNSGCKNEHPMPTN